MPKIMPSARVAIDPAPKPAVLVVDADADTRALYRQLLEHLGYTVLEASDGREALTKVFTPPPALIVTETTLPFVDGYSLCQILRRDRVTAAMPILVVTADARPAETDKARRAGADVVLVKPASIEAVVGAVQQLMDARQPGSGVRPQAPRTTPSPESTQGAACPQTTRRNLLVRGHARFRTVTPPEVPPRLVCPSCDSNLTYDYSYLGGVHARNAEQWDYYICDQGCGIFQYRHRTKKLRVAP